MLKLNKLCAVCEAVKDNRTILNKIFNTKTYMPSSQVSLNQVWQEYEHLFSYRSLLNHTKRHQFMSENDYNSRHLRQIATQAEKQILKKQIESKEVWDEIINQGMEKLQSGEITMKTADLLKAAKDKSDYQLKSKDQELAFAEMMYFFASGENQNNLRSPYDRRIVEGAAVEDNNPAPRTPENSGTEQNGPGAVYYPPSWDAAT